MRCGGRSWPMLTNAAIESLNFIEEATSMGAAVIGGVAAGLFKDFEVIRRFIAVEHLASPVAGNVKTYRQRRAVLEKAYRGLEGVYEDLAVS